MRRMSPESLRLSGIVREREIEREAMHLPGVFEMKIEEFISIKPST